MHPRQMRETESPVRPSFAYCMFSSIRGEMFSAIRQCCGYGQTPAQIVACQGRRKVYESISIASHARYHSRWPIGQADFLPNLILREGLMRVLFVHPSPLMYSEIYLRLEPLGMERVAAAVRSAGHEVRIVDLQIFKHHDLFAEFDHFKPQAVGFSVNYLANVPEVIDLAKALKARARDRFVFVGGHSGSFVAEEILEHADGAVDCVLRGEGESSAQMLLEAIGTDSVAKIPGAVTTRGVGPTPIMLHDLDKYFPA